MQLCAGRGKGLGLRGLFLSCLSPDPAFWKRSCPAVSPGPRERGETRGRGKTWQGGGVSHVVALGTCCTQPTSL